MNTSLPSAAAPEAPLSVADRVEQLLQHTGTELHETSRLLYEAKHFERAQNFHPQLNPSLSKFPKDLVAEKMDLTPLLKQVPSHARICVSTPEGYMLYSPEELIRSETIGWQSKKKLLTLFAPLFDSKSPLHDGSLDEYLSRIHWLMDYPAVFSLLYYYCYNRGFCEPNGQQGDGTDIERFEPYYGTFQVLTDMMQDASLDKKAFTAELRRLLEWYGSQDEVFARLLRNQLEEGNSGVSTVAVQFPVVEDPVYPEDIQQEVRQEMQEMYDFPVPEVPVISGIHRYQYPRTHVHPLERVQRQRRVQRLQQMGKKALLTATAAASIAGAGLGLKQAYESAQQPPTPRVSVPVTPITHATAAPVVKQAPSAVEELSALYGSNSALEHWLASGTPEQQQLRLERTRYTLEVLQSHGGLSATRLEQLALKASEKQMSYDLFLQALLALPATPGSGISQNLVLKYQQLHQQSRREVLTSATWKQAVAVNFQRDGFGNYQQEHIRDSISTQDRFYLGPNGSITRTLYS